MLQIYGLALLTLGSLPALAATKAAPKEAPGMADLHVHMFSEYAFGGAWIHGTVEGEISKALSSCEVHFDPFSLLGDHARVKFPLISRFIGKTLGSGGDTGNHPDRHEAYPDFKGWPRWDTIAHQQVWEGHLKAAHEAGLNLMILSMVNYETLCELMPDENKKYPDCSDSAALERQIQAADQFQERHPWFQIVKSPMEARVAIQAGKMAVVLSIEETHLFGDDDWRIAFNSAKNAGVTTLQLAHQENNRFAGAAIHNPAFRFFSWIHDFKKNGRWWQIFTPWKFGFQTEEIPGKKTRLNLKGLTPEGRELVLAMMKNGMPIDLAHLSERTVKEIAIISRSVGGYPLYVSHGHFREAMDDGKFSVWEKSASDETLEIVKASGGMFGLRTGPEHTKSFPGSTAPNDCQGSSKSFAQTYQYGVSRGVQVALGSDFNGFIQQTRPRFGDENETCGAETDSKLRAAQQKAQTQPLNKRFDHSGLGDISQLQDVITEIKSFGVNTDSLDHSAEAYIRMWERSVSISKKL